MRNTLVALLTGVTFLAGCAHNLNLTLHPQDGGGMGQGVAQDAGKTVTITLHGRIYSGTYVYDGGKVAYINTYGSSTTYSGTESATAFGSGFGSAYVPGSGNGRIFAISPDGDAIRCEFQYSGGSGLGICRDNAGKEYDLQLHD